MNKMQINASNKINTAITGGNRVFVEQDSAFLAGVFGTWVSAAQLQEKTACGALSPAWGRFPSR